MTDAATPFESHDHAACRRDALKAAEMRVASSGARMTRDRQAVLEVLLADHRPQGAYKILESIDWKGRRPAPAAVYRALDFLVAHGLAHKVESLNAYIACDQADHPHRAKILICEDCGRVAELAGTAIDKAIARAAAAADFTVKSSTVEVAGICNACAGGRQ